MGQVICGSDSRVIKLACIDKKTQRYFDGIVLIFMNNLEKLAMEEN